MPEVPISQLQQAIRDLHGCDSDHLYTVHVIEDLEGLQVWEGNVYVFALLDHPTAAKCYAWSHAIEGSDKRRFVTVLHEPPVDSPQQAVRAAIVQELGSEAARRNERD